MHNLEVLSSNERSFSTNDAVLLTLHALTPALKWRGQQFNLMVLSLADHFLRNVTTSAVVLALMAQQVALALCLCLCVIAHTSRALVVARAQNTYARLTANRTMICSILFQCATDFDCYGLSRCPPDVPGRVNAAYPRNVLMPSKEDCKICRYKFTLLCYVFSRYSCNHDGAVCYM